MEEEIKEKWKPYKYGNLNYLVSNFGNIIGCGRNKELKQRLNKDGYLMVTLGDMEHRIGRPVHLLVAELFVQNDNPETKTEVNHKDTNRQNPRFDNLEWVSHYDNVQYSVKLGNYAKPQFKGKGNPNYGNHILSDYYKNNPDIAKEKLSRPAEQNGRATEVIVYDLNMNEVNRFKYIGAFCQWLIDNGYTKRKKTSVNSLRSSLGIYFKENKPYMNMFYLKKL